MNPIQLPVQIVPQKIVRPNLNVVYPMITAGTNPMAMHNMNRQIYHLVESLITEQGYYQSPQTVSMTGYFEIKNNQRGVLSLTIVNYAYPEKAAHGMTIIKSLNFDIRTGRNYPLEQLFLPGSDYQTRLETIIQAQIKAREVPVISEFPGVSPHQDYYIADKALVIYYQLYDLAPYAYGFPMFPISVYDLQDIISPTGLLGPLATNS